MTGNNFVIRIDKDDYTPGSEISVKISQSYASDSVAYFYVGTGASAGLQKTAYCAVDAMSLDASVKVKAEIPNTPPPNTPPPETPPETPPNTPPAPQTGDNSNIPLWSLMGIVSVAGLGLCGMLLRKKAHKVR